MRFTKKLISGILSILVGSIGVYADMPMSENKDYNIFVDGDTATVLKNDEYVSALQNVSFTNVPKKYAYTIRKIELTDQEGGKVNALYNAATLSKLTITKNTEDTLPAMLLIAISEGDLLTKLQQVDISDMIMTDTMVTYDIDMSLENLTVDSSVSIMIWDKNTLAPYSLAFDAPAGYPIYVKTVANQLYTIPVSIRGGGTTFKLKFDNNYFKVDNLCKAANRKITSAGQASSNIRIDEVTKDSATFTYLGEPTKDGINQISLQALQDGETRISIVKIN